MKNPSATETVDTSDAALDEAGRLVLEADAMLHELAEAGAQLDAVQIIMKSLVEQLESLYAEREEDPRDAMIESLRAQLEALYAEKAQEQRAPLEDDDEKGGTPSCHS